MQMNCDSALLARQSIVDAMRSFEEKGFNHGSSGNISVREGGHIWVTPTGRDLDYGPAGHEPCLP